MAYLTIGSDGRLRVDEQSELGASFLKKLVSKVAKVFGGKAKAPAVEEVTPGAATTASVEAAAGGGGATAQVMKIAPYLLLGVGGLVLVMTLLKRKRR